MLDIIDSTRMLTDTGLKPDQAAAIAHVVQQAVEQGNHVTPDQFRPGISEVRTEVANLDTRLSTQMAEMRTEMARSETRLTRWVGGAHANRRRHRHRRHGGGSVSRSRVMLYDSVALISRQATASLWTWAANHRDGMQSVTVTGDTYDSPTRPIFGTDYGFAVFSSAGGSQCC